MNIQHFYSILQDAQQLNEIDDIKKISSQYPFFSIPQMLCISYLYQTNDNQFSENLKKFSHNISDRKYFFQHLKSQKYFSNHTNKPTDNNIPKNAEPTPVLQEQSSLSTPEINTSESMNISEEKTSDNLTKENISTETKENVNIKSIENISTETIIKELNKSISESIVQTELLKIETPIQTKATEIIQKKEEALVQQNLSDNNTIDSQKETQQAPSNDEHTLPPNSLADILKKFSRTNTTSNTNNTASNTNSHKKEKIKQQQEIIDKILANPPKTIKPSAQQKFFSAENKAKESLLETEDLVSETLAQIYASQGNIHKAIRAYEILCLKFPQKNTYFAAKIEELKNQLKK